MIYMCQRDISSLYYCFQIYYSSFAVLDMYELLAPHEGSPSPIILSVQQGEFAIVPCLVTDPTLNVIFKKVSNNTAMVFRKFIKVANLI